MSTHFPPVLGVRPGVYFVYLVLHSLRSSPQIVLTRKRFINKDSHKKPTVKLLKRCGY